MNEGIVPNDLRQSVEEIIIGKKSLYQINSDTFNHAIVNVKAVYEKNVIKAIDKLTDSKTYLFNVEESKDILWDVIFLSKLVKSQAKEDKYGNKTINSSYYKDIFNQRLDINNLDSKINKVQLILVSADLEENVKKEIKDAIVILNDLRNALAHNDNGSYETDEKNEQIKFHSDSKGSELYCDISVRYLLKLGSGIVPLPEHETLARETDIFIDYTCTNLNINLKELPNFFYRAKPENLNYLLNICNYDYSKLKDLPEKVFFVNIERIKWIIDNYCKTEDVYDISKLKDLPSSIFSLTIKKTKWLIDNCCKVDDIYDISKLEGLPENIFSQDFKEIKWIMDNYCKVEDAYDISKLKDLPEYMFSDDIEKKIWIIDNYCKVDDISKLKDIHYCFFWMDKEEIKLIMDSYCKVDDVYDISKLKNLPGYIFSNDIEKIKWIIDNYCKVDDIYDLSKLKDFPPELFTENKAKIKWIMNNYCKVGDVYDISKLKDLPEYLFKVSIEDIKWLIDIYYEVYGVCDISKLKKLPEISSSSDMEKLDWLIYNYCKVDGIYDISKLKDLPKYLFKADIEDIKWLIDNYCKVDNTYDISKLKELPYSLFFYDIDFEQLKWLSDNYCKVDDVYEISKLMDIPDFLLSSRLKKFDWMQNFKIDLDVLHERFSVKKEIIKWLIDNYCKVDDVYNLSKLKELPQGLFYQDIEKIKWIIDNYCEVDGVYDLSKLKDLPDVLFVANIERIKWISDNYCISNRKYDITKLLTIPKELFECDIELLKQIGKHNDMNLLKSVLGNGNDKLVALIIYMDSLFSAYDVKRKVTNLDLMNIEFDKVHPNIQSGVDSINKSYNSSNFDNVQEDYFLGDLTDMVKTLFKQFDKMAVQINEEGITNGLINSMDDKVQGINVNLVRMLRNASQHFRVEVDEENSNMLIISDYEKEFDFGNVSKNVKSISKISIEDFFKLLKSIELNNEQEKTKKENYTINNSGNNLLQKVKEKYEDINNFPNKMLMTSFIHTCLKIEGYNSKKETIDGIDYIIYTNGEDVITDTIDNLYGIYNSYNKTEVFNAATLFIELIEFDKNELLLQDIFDINLIAEELLITDSINYSKKIQNNEVVFEIDGKIKKAINIYKQYKNNKNKSHVLTEVLINECRNTYGVVYSRSR